MLDRTIAPPFNRSTNFELLKPEQVNLSNGVALYFVAGGKQDVIKVELIIKAGRWYENTSGASHFTANLLLKGTLEKNSAEIANIFDLYGAHVEINPGLDVISVSLYSLNKYLEPSLSLLAEVLTRSKFSEKELDQYKSIFLQNLKVNNEKTSFLASKLFRKQIFGELHPYGKELEAGDVNAIDREGLTAHYAHHFQDLFIIVSGKIDDQNKRLITDTFTTLPFQAVASKSHTIKAIGDMRNISEKEGSMQSSVRIGKRFIGRTHPEYADVLFINHILGGYFGSRLMKNIREEKGLSYGIHSSIHTLQQDNYLVIGADVNKENLELTFSEVKKELNRIRTQRIDKDELTVARNHFIGSLQAEITNPFAHADKLKNILLFKVPSNYYQQLINRLDQLHADDLLKAAHLHFHEDSFYEVAVG